MDFTTDTFPHEEVCDPDTLRAIIEIKRGPKPGPFSSPLWVGSFGAVIWGRREIRHSWGACYARADDILRGMAVRHILDHYRNGAKLIVFTKGLDDQLWHFLGRPDIIGHEVYRPLVESRKVGEWRLEPIKGREVPEGHSFAKHLADEAYQKAKLLEPMFGGFPEVAKQSAIIATELDPDPQGLVTTLGGRR